MRATLNPLQEAHGDYRPRPEPVVSHDRTYDKPRDFMQDAFPRQHGSRGNLHHAVARYRVGELPIAQKPTRMTEK